MEKVQNLLNFSDVEKSWKSKDAKKTKRTEVGLDVIEERFMDDDELIDVDDDINDDIDIDDEEDIEDIDIDEDEDEIDDIEDEDEDDDEGGDWKEELTSLINQIIEDGVDPNDVYEFVNDDILSGYLKDEEDEDDDEYEDEDEDEDDDIEIEPEEESLDEEDVADDDEGDDIGESFKSFKKWNR